MNKPKTIKRYFHIKIQINDSYYENTDNSMINEAIKSIRNQLDSLLPHADIMTVDEREK